MFALYFQASVLSTIGFEWFAILVPVMAMSVLIVRATKFELVLAGIATWSFDAVWRDRASSTTASSDVIESVPVAAGAPVVADAFDGADRMSFNHQWDRVAGVLHASVERADKANFSHGSAGRQLDAADYELSCLMDELAPLMPDLVGGDTSPTAGANVMPEQLPVEDAVAEMPVEAGHVEPVAA